MYSIFASNLLVPEYGNAKYSSIGIDYEGSAYVPCHVWRASGSQAENSLDIHFFSKASNLKIVFNGLVLVLITVTKEQNIITYQAENLRPTVRIRE